MNNLPLIVIVGPTASGKSDLAMQVARQFNGELICADSRTVYKGMDIGTAKPSPEDRQQIRHHLLDIVEPGQLFTAADFKRLALKAITDIRSRGKLPIMVGGTGLYIDAVIFDYQFSAPANPEERKKLQALSINELQQICRDKNIEIPVNSKNKRHLIRAIELNGLPNNTSVIQDHTLVVGISTDRELLRKRVNRRAEQMIRQGILKEVQMLGERYGWESEAMTGNIYRIFKDVVQGQKQLSGATEEFVRSDMALAKRQMTWFKRNPHIIWGTPDELLAIVQKFVVKN